MEDVRSDVAWTPSPRPRRLSTSSGRGRLGRMPSGGLLSISRRGSRGSAGRRISRRSRSGRRGRPATRSTRASPSSGSVLAVSSATLGTGLVLVATVLTFLDLAGITPTTRRLLGRRASQNVVSWGDRDMPGAVLLVAHYDTGPTRTRPLRPMFVALLLVLACCVLRAGGMEGTALTVVQFIPTVVLIVYVALLLDIALSPAATRRERQRLRRRRRPPPRRAPRRRARVLRRPRRVHRLAEGHGARACAPSSSRTARS